MLLLLFNDLLYHYLLMCKCMSINVHLNGTVQFTFLSVIRLNITIVASFDSLIVILVILTYRKNERVSQSY